MSVEIGNGQKALFWLEKWLQGKGIQDLVPCLFSSIGPRIRKGRTVAQGLANDAWVQDISGALTVQVILDFLMIWEATRNVHLQSDTPDKFIWKWTADHCFSTASAYWAFFIGQREIYGARCLRKTRAPGKCKFFIWLVLHDRCWTAERRKRHNLQDDDSCALCAQESETITHLLLNCCFAREIWYRTLFMLNWHELAPNGQCLDLADWWTTARKSIAKAERMCFDSLVILTSWMLWNERNRRTFDSKSKTVPELLASLEEEAISWLLARLRHLNVFVAAVCSFHGRQIISM